MAPAGRPPPHPEPKGAPPRPLRRTRSSLFRTLSLSLPQPRKSREEGQGAAKSGSEEGGSGGGGASCLFPFSRVDSVVGAVEETGTNTVGGAPLSEHSDVSSITTDPNVENDLQDDTFADLWAPDVLRSCGGSEVGAEAGVGGDGAIQHAVAEAAGKLRGRLFPITTPEGGAVKNQKRGDIGGSHGGGGRRGGTWQSDKGGRGGGGGEGAEGIEPLHARIGGVMRDVAAQAAAGDAANAATPAANTAANTSDNDDNAVRRMESACKAILLFCGDMLAPIPPGEQPQPMPPLGSHLIRCCPLLNDNEEAASAANLYGEKAATAAAAAAGGSNVRDAVPPASPPPPPRPPMSLYVQDQCSYMYDSSVRTWVGRNTKG
jgi:hypothetical protein